MWSDVQQTWLKNNTFGLVVKYLLKLVFDLNKIGFISRSVLLSSTGVIYLISNMCMQTIPLFKYACTAPRIYFLTMMSH